MPKTYTTQNAALIHIRNNDCGCQLCEDRNELVGKLKSVLAIKISKGAKS